MSEVLGVLAVALAQIASGMESKVAESTDWREKCQGWKAAVLAIEPAIYDAGQFGSNSYAAASDLNDGRKIRIVKTNCVTLLMKAE